MSEPYRLRQLDPEMPEVMADGEQLYRVFINLANNAQDAMPDGGQLTISTREGDGYAEVAFQDTGVGITEEVMKKIFEPLFTTKTKGTGLGLAVCQQIAAKHGGTIQTSSAPGKGSTFTVRASQRKICSDSLDFLPDTGYERDVKYNFHNQQPMTTAITKGVKLAREIRARFSRGKIEPLEEVDLKEGTEVIG